MCFNVHSTTTFRACMHSHTKVQKDVDCYQADCRRSAAHNRANCRLCSRDPESCRTKRLPHRDVETFDTINLCPWCQASQPRVGMRV